MIHNRLIFKDICIIICNKNSSGQIMSDKITDDKNVALTEL